MSKYKLTEGLFLYPTPAGAYYAVCSDEMDEARHFIKEILLQESTLPLNAETLAYLTGSEDAEENMALLFRCQTMNWVQGMSQERTYPAENLDEVLPKLVSTLSESNQVLLADRHGFYVANYGFPEETAEELAALSAELSIIYNRRFGQLLNNLGNASQSWALVDVFGNSQLGFWPFFIGQNTFVAIIAGVPHFNQPEFVDLIWALSRRYAV